MRSPVSMERFTAAVEVVRGARGEAASSCAGDAVEDGVCV